MDPHCFDADPDPDPDPGGRGGRSAKNVHPPGKILGTPLGLVVNLTLDRSNFEHLRIFAHKNI